MLHVVRFGQSGPPGPLKPRPHTGYCFILPPLLLVVSLLQTPTWTNCPVNASSSMRTWAMFGTPAESLVSFIQRNRILCVLLLVYTATCIRVTTSHLVLADTSICTGNHYLGSETRNNCSCHWKMSGSEKQNSSPFPFSCCCVILSF